MTADQDLLRQYAETRAEAAFAELVRRHVDLVYAVALRKVGGDAHLAEDVAQRVFTALATKAAALAKHPVLTGWLFTSTHYTATQLVRGERRRRIREQEAHAMNELLDDPTPPVDWERLRPLLDDLVLELEERDRDAVLLRFFEGRAFAEIGARLRLTEEGARARVDRAVDKLQTLLARRGITSTGAALGVVLANQAGAAAPAGLAASVTTLAMNGAAAGATLLGFMSTAKITGGVLGAAALLVLSVATNVWFVTHSPAAVTVEAPRRDVAAAKAPAPAGVSLAALADDPGQLRDRLQTAGLGPALTRALVEGMLRRQYREKLSETRAERARHGWWREAWAGQMDRPPPMNDDPELMQKMVFDPLERLFGPDPAAQAEYEARFEFLPAEKRAAAIALEREFDRALALRTGSENGSAELAAQRAREEKRTQLLASFTSQEGAEYELRRALAGGQTTARMAQIDATEAEFRAIMRIVNVPADAGADRADRAVRDDGMMQELVKAIGFDRATDYIWSASTEYTAYARVAREANLPPGTAGQVVQLAAETADRAIAISREATLDVAQKRAALLALQQTVRPQFDALLPPAVQARMGAEPMQWFTALANGRFRLMSTALNSDQGLTRTIGTVTVENPWPAHTPLPPLPRRPSP